MKTRVITNEVNNGIVINNLFNEWLNIKTQCQHDKWSKKVGTMRFGTFKTDTVFDVLQKFQLSNMSNWEKESFLHEMSQAVKYYEIEVMREKKLSACLPC